MRTDEFDFPFPEDLIAKEPSPRGQSRLVVVARQDRPSSAPISAGQGKAPIRAWGQIGDLAQWLRPGDVLVLNDTRVLPARLRGVDAQGRPVEILLLKPQPFETEGGTAAGGKDAGPCWQAMVKPGKRFRLGDQVRFGRTSAPGAGHSGLSAEVTAVEADGTRVLRFAISRDDFFAALHRFGEMPLPPYIDRDARPDDAVRYQSVFARHLGSVAAPTASLHFDEALLNKLRAVGIETVAVTLHVGAGTFKPVAVENAEEHVMHSEVYTLSPEAAARLNDARRAGRRLIAVGTTAARVLETCATGADDALQAGQGETRLFVLPGYRWKAVDGLLTNFHWPRSTLFMLVSSLLGTEPAKAAYAEAMARRFRLFSYGDAMLIL